ncbi:MAG: thiol reductant ABC exporter subunit CydD, partial [Halomonadaceae bacterium]|nr:thiol reductant ABC exporter subunit CydD [Halomonadaceae bacterium]
MRNDTRAAASRRWLALHAAGQRGWLVLSATAGLVVGLLTMMQMLLLAWIVSRLLVSGDTLGELGSVFVTLLLVLLFRAVCQWAQE